MKRAIILIFIFFSSILLSIAQNAVTDSLQNLLKKENSAEARIGILYELVRYGYRSSLPEARLHYQELHGLVLKKPDYQKGKILDLAAAGVLQMADSKFEEAAASFQQALQLAGNKNFVKQRAELLNYAGVIKYLTGDIEAALTLFEQSLAIKKQLGDDREIVKSLSNIGSIYMAQSKLQKALAAYLDVLKYDKKLNDRAAIASDYNNISLVFIDKTDYASATNYARLALKEYIPLPDSLGIGRAFLNLGTINLQKQQYDSAMVYFKKAGFFLERIGNAYELSKVNQNMGLILLKQGRPKEAELLLNKTIETKKALEDWGGVAGALGNLGDVYRKTGRSGQAIALLEQSNELAKKAGRNDYLMNNTRMLSEVYAAQNDFKTAYQYYNAYTSLKDTISTDAYSRQLSELQTQYETAEKEQKITLLNKQNIIQKLVISRRNILIGIIAGLFIIAAVVGGLFYNRYKLKQEARLQNEIMRQQDLATKAILEAEENERKRIAADLHDGLGQMFSAVKMNLSGLESQVAFTGPVARENYEKTVALVDESCREVRSISHQMAPNVLLKSGLVSAVRDFVTKIDASRLKINLDVAGLNERLNSNVETVLYRVIQESVNNVIKHAEATQLDIQLTKDEEGLSAMIEDNGKGFALTGRVATDGIGLKNMVTRVEYLKGTVDFDSAPGKGTVVSIWVPVSLN